MTFAILNQPPAAMEALPAVLQPIALHGLAKDVLIVIRTQKKC
jgi:hypothetical protein